MFVDEELVRLLGVVSNNNNNASGSGESVEEDPAAPVGKYLANPTALLKFTAADPNLRRQLKPSAPNAAQTPAASSSLFGATNATANNAGAGSMGSMPLPLAYITLKGWLAAVTPQIAR